MRRRARPPSLTAVAPAQHLSLAEQTGEPRRRYSPSAPEWPGPWQTPQFAILNHAAIDSGIPRESATQRLGIIPSTRAEDGEPRSSAVADRHPHSDHPSDLAFWRTSLDVRAHPVRCVATEPKVGRKVPRVGAGIRR